MITSASIVLFAAFVLWMAQDRFLRSAAGKRRFGAQSRARCELTGGGALVAMMGGAFFFLCLGMFLQGKFEGVWIPALTRRDHPFWFWTMAVIFFPSAIGVIYWGISDFIRGMAE